MSHVELTAGLKGLVIPMAQTVCGTLYVVGTPIGNLGDISPRAVQVLGSCDFIAAEDTRVTLKLLNHLGIKKPMTSYHKFNENEKSEGIVGKLLAGQTCALVSDAGMPCISDPGRELVDICRERGIEVVAVPGPCALVTALAISGMPSGRFTFEGFLTTAKPGRREHLEQLINESRTMIFYEAPHKLPATLADMLAFFGDREVAIVKELTKLHERVERTTLSRAVLDYPKDVKLKGEFVLIVAGAAEPEKAAGFTLDDAVAVANEHIKCGKSLNQAAKLAAVHTGLKKSDIYKELLKPCS